MTHGRTRAFRLLALAAAAAILALVIFAADPAEVWTALADVRGAKPWLVVLLNFVVIALWVARSTLVLHQMGKAISPAVLLPITVLGNVAGSLTPGGSGELLRASALQRSAGLRLGEAVSLVAYERVLSTYLLLLSTVACLALVALRAAPAIAISAGCLALVLLPWLSACLVLPRLPASSTIEGGGVARKLLRYALQLAEEIQVLVLSLPLLLGWSALTILSFAVIALQFSLTAGSIGADIDLLEGWVAFGGSGFAVIASLLPLGIGIGDGSVAAIIDAVSNVAFERATAVAVLLRATVTLPLVLIALLCYAYLVRTRPEIVARPAEPEPHQT